MESAVYPIFMELGMKCLLDLARRSTEDHLSAAGRHCFDGKALIFEPPDNLVQIVIGKTELAPELLRRQPLMKLRRFRILLRRKQPFQVSLLNSVGLEHQHDSLDWSLGADAPRIEFRPG